MINDNDFGYLKYEKQGRIKLIVKKSLLIGTALFSIAAFIYITINAYYFVYHDQNNDKIKIIKSPAEPIKEVVGKDGDGIIIKDMDKAVYENLVANKKEDLEKTSIIKSPTVPDIALDHLAINREKEEIKEQIVDINDGDVVDMMNIRESESKNKNLDSSLVVKSQEIPAKTIGKKHIGKVQIAAMNSVRAAQEYWIKLNSQYPQLFSNLEYYVQRVDLKERGVVYRLQIGNFGNQIAAEEFCTKFIIQTKKGKGDCIIVE